MSITDNPDNYLKCLDELTLYVKKFQEENQLSDISTRMLIMGSILNDYEAGLKRAMETQDQRLHINIMNDLGSFINALNNVRIEYQNTANTEAKDKSKWH